MMPTIFNADTIALINGGKDSRDQVNYWSDLVSEAWRGAVVVQKDSAICAVEMLLALTGNGDLEVSDISDLSIEEIDLFIQHIYRYLKQGQFKGIWEVEEDLANLVKPDQPLLCSLWWSGAMRLRAEGHDVEMIA